MKIFNEINSKILQILIDESEYSEDMIRTSKVEDCVLLRIIWIQTLYEAGLTDTQIVNTTGLTQQLVNRSKIGYEEKSRQSFMIRYLMNITRKLFNKYMEDLT